MLLTILDEDCLIADDFNHDFSVLSATLSELRERKITVQKKSSVYEIATHADGLTLCDLLFSCDFLEADLRAALVAQIDLLPSWDETVQHAQWKGGSSRALALNSAQIGTPAACVVFPSYMAPTQHAKLRLVSTVTEVHELLRAVPDLLNFNEPEFIAHCDLIFDRLIFKPGIASEIRRFSRPFDRFRGQLVQGLAALNDHLAALLDQQIIETELGRRFQAVSGFDFSSESVNTRRNRRAMAEREVDYNGSKFSCLWHLKFEPTINRIHVHFFHEKIGNGKQILVGIFCDHLSA